MVKGEYPKIVVLANGAFPKHPIPVNILKNAETIICCDGAADELIKFGLNPSVIVGDMDSISAENKLKFKEIIVQIDDQETNDQTKAVNWAVENGIKEIAILGATGMREDHSISNISLLCNYVKVIKVLAFSDYGIFTPVLNSTSFNSFAGQQVSIFSLWPETKISSENLKFTLEQLSLKSWWMGSLNESTGDRFSLKFESGELIVFQVF
jgi:thiamine pyrophosphokinase